MRDRSICDGPRTTRQEYLAEEDAQMRREIREEILSLHREMGMEGAFSEREIDALVADVLWERKTPHPSLSAEERQ